MNDDISNLVQQAQTDLFNIILDHLRQERINLEESKRLAQEFLEQMPINDRLELLNVLKILGQTYSPAQDLYLKYAQNMEAEEKQIKMEKISEMIKQEAKYE